MLTTREDCWPDDKNPMELYLYVSDGDRETRIEIMKEAVYADDTDIILRTKADLLEWIRVLRKAFWGT